MRSCDSHVTRQCGGEMALCSSGHVALRWMPSAVHCRDPSGQPPANEGCLRGGEGGGGEGEEGKERRGGGGGGEGRGRPKE